MPARPDPGDIPEELRDVLDGDPTARELWDALSPSHRNEYRDYVREAKQRETRVRRAGKAVELMRRRRARRSCAPR